MIDVGSYCCFFGREALALVEDQLLLHGCRCRFFGFGIGVMNSAPAPSVDQVSGRLTRLVELPVLTRVLVRRVEDRVVEERVGHSLWFWASAQPSSRILVEGVGRHPAIR